MEAVKGVDGMIVGKLDRFGRHCRGFLGIVEDFFVPSGKKLILLDLLGLDVTTPSGKFEATIFAGFSELERAKILERIRGGIILAMEKGVTFGSPRYGEKAQSKGRVEVEDEAKVIEFIRRQYRLKVSLSGIAQKLNDRNIPTKQGKKWTAQGVKNILGRFKHYKKAS
jgi:DNA invertase Pin-like site-specific DNA recombinase